MIYKVGHSLAALLFLTMAWLQLNDPDPLFWVVLYLAVAAVPVSRLLGAHPPGLADVALGLCLGGVLISLPGFLDYLGSGDWAAIGGSMSADKPYIEAARECGGALMGVACVLLCRSPS